MTAFDQTYQSRVATAFGRAADTYDGAADLQALTAQALAERVLALPPPANPVPANPVIVEIGCGTGGLTRRLVPRIAGRWIITDLAPAMVEATKSRLPDRSALDFRVMNGEFPDLTPASADLIVSNLAAQWFGDMGSALTRLARCLKPGGRMLITTLGRGSLAEWQAAVAATGHHAGTPDFIAEADLARLTCGPGQTRLYAETIAMRYNDGRAFLASLRDLGARTPKPGYRPLPAPILRRAIANLGAPCTVRYLCLTVEYQAP